ncbi:Olfactory receptor 6K3 [Lemmus lemmus]
MDHANHTWTHTFILAGFTPTGTLRPLTFMGTLCIYLLTLAGNLFIIVLVQADSGLSTPMYFFISVLSFLEICYTTVTIPRMLYNLVSKDKIISFVGCLLQMYFFHSFGVTEGLVLTIMAIDRYVAICNPLRYAIIITPQLCTQLSTGSFILGFLMLLPEIVWISTLPFCGPNHIHQLFCDLEPVLLLACADTSMILVEDVIHAISILTCVSIITLSYLRIITVILRFPSAEGRRKAFSTCVSHLTVFLLFFGSVALMYLRFSATYFLFWDTAIALAFAVLSPFFNPIIYSLRNKEIKEAIKKHIGQVNILIHKSRNLT